MKMYFDESGNTGCVMPDKNNELFSEHQPHFVLCGVITYNQIDEKQLIERYKNFKQKFHIDGELKGSDLLKKENNSILKYFIENLIDDKHFHICCYDKKYYLATMLALYFMGAEFQRKNPLMYYMQASALTLENVEIFQKFCQSVQEDTDDARKNFVRYVANYDFKHIDLENNYYVLSAKAMLTVFKNDPVPEFPLPRGSYLREDITNMINLVALGELLLSIKFDHEKEFNQVQVIHDHIQEFEADFLDTLSSTRGIDLSFVDSKDELLIQYADNVASIFRKAFTQTTKIFRNREQWQERNYWFPKLLAKLLNKLSFNSLKLVNPICDCVLSFCVQEMFSDTFPDTCRNDATFRKIFMKHKPHVLQSLAETDYSYSF